MGRRGVALVLGLAGLGAVAWALNNCRKSDDAFRIGAVLDPGSAGVREALVLAAEELAREGRPIDLVLKEGSAAAKLDELHQEGIDHVVEIAGDLREAAATARKNNQVLMTSVHSTEQGRFGGHVFRMGTEGAAAPAIVRSLIEDRVARPVVVFDAEHRAQADAFTQAYASQGVAARLEIARGQALALRIPERLAEADAVVLFTTTADAAAIVKGSSDKLRFFGLAELAEVRDLGSAFARVFVVVPEGTSMPARRAQVEAAWKKKFGSDPSPVVFKAYDALHALVRAVAEAKGDVTKAATFLRATKLDGASGRVEFDENGDRVVSHARGTFTEQGTLVPVLPPLPARK